MQSQFWIVAVSGIAAMVLAIATIFRGRRSVPPWAFAAGMALLAVEALWTALALRAGTPEQLANTQQWRLVTTSLLAATWLLFAVTYARGNASKFLSQYQWMLVAAFLAPSSIALGFREELVRFVVQSGPDGFWALRLGWPGLAVHLALLIGAVLVLVNLERTYRASVGTMRWRIKFMLLGVALIVGVRIFTSSQALLFRSIELSWQATDSAGLLLACALVTRSLIRHGNFSTEVYPSHAILQNSLTVVLVGIYLLAVGIIAKSGELFGGDTTLTLKAFLLLVGLVVLALALQSERMKARMQRFVSRHLRRPAYDYRAVWRRFSQGSVSHADEKQLCRALVELVSDTLSALSVSIWRIDTNRSTLKLAASTVHLTKAESSLRLQSSEIGDMERHFRKHPVPLDLDGDPPAWAETLRQCHPRQFPDKGGRRVCLAVAGREELIGFMIVGDRVNGVPFSVQDLDMLACVGEHAASGLLNVQLSQELARGREFEAFQSMAAFFVHDLKNAVSALGLMVKNIPEHWDDPAFRHDTIRGISKTVENVNKLVARLSQFRERLQLKCARANLNEVVSEALEATGLVNKRVSPEVMGSSCRGELELDLKLGPDLPAVEIDVPQFARVVTNLATNAAESGATRMEISTTALDSSVILTVADNGVGMSADFVENDLFKPFKTTKQRGLGIGMFQSRMIAEAHGGRISVDSVPGHGTTFRVLLPIVGGPRTVDESQVGLRAKCAPALRSPPLPLSSSPAIVSPSHRL